MSTRSPPFRDLRLARALLSTVSVTLFALSLLLLPVLLLEPAGSDCRSVIVPVCSSAETTTALTLPDADWLLLEVLPV